MSKAFTKEDAWEDPVIPPRPPLPEGVPNYVTPRGLSLLRAELAELEAERQSLDAQRGDEAEHRRRLAIVGGRMRELAARLASAEVVDPARHSHEAVRFGARVKVRSVTGDGVGEERQLEIVGVDEADAGQGRVAFIAPIARAILGLEVGESAGLDTPRGEELLQVLSIEYSSE